MPSADLAIAPVGAGFIVAMPAHACDHYRGMSAIGPAPGGIARERCQTIDAMWQTCASNRCLTSRASVRTAHFHAGSPRLRWPAHGDARLESHV